MVWTTQTLCGLPMTSYATYFYLQAGISTEAAFDLSVGMYALAILGNLLSWSVMRVVGRRTLYLWGCAACTVIMFAAGCVGLAPDSPAIAWSLGSLIIFFTFIYDITIGPICYSLVAEIPSTRLRVKTVVLARVAYNVAFMVAGVLMPYMLNPTAWNWRGKTCFFWVSKRFRYGEVLVR